MKNDFEIPALDVKPGYEVSTATFAEENGIPHDIVLKELRQQLREHYYNYGTKPFNLQYSPVSGHVIQVTSVVGLIKTQHFLLSLLPKIPRLSLGKCLAMSQEVGTAVVSFDNREPIKALISSKASYSTVEALTFSFLDSLISVKNNGYARRFDEVFVLSTKIGANIEFQMSINQAQLLPPIVSELEPTNDVFPNQILKAAYEKALSLVRTPKLKRSLLQFREDFTNISTLEPTTNYENILLHYFAFRRSDYERALKIALSIINGNAIEHEGYMEYLPAFTIDLDRLFEEFVAEITMRLLSPKKFELLTQPRFEHDTMPSLPGEIIPDLLVLHRNGSDKILIDTKNKYSGLRELGQFSVSNPDLYQICYYALNLGIKTAILVYPATYGMPQYPIRFSESEISHNRKVEKFLISIERFKRTMVAKTPCKFDLYAYNIDLSGPMENSIRSIASLCLFIEYLLER